MDRFFSKLDLRDIKIKPEGTRFLPTEDDVEVEQSDPDTVPGQYDEYDTNPPTAPAFETPLEEPAFAPTLEEPPYVAPRAAAPSYANGGSALSLDGDNG